MRNRRRSLRPLGLLLALLVVSALSQAALPAGAGARAIGFAGQSVRVPPGWRVYRLAQHPGMCVRLDRRAVYLGPPGAEPALSRRRCRRPAAGDPRRPVARRAAQPPRRCHGAERRRPGASAGGQRLHRPRLRRLQRALLADDGGLGSLALPGDRRLHRRRQPGLLAAEPDRELGQRPDRRRLAPDPDLRRPAVADQQLQQLRQAQPQPRRPPRAPRRPSTRSPRRAPSRSGPAARSTSTWSPTRRTSSASAATLAFLEAWTNKLHSLGYVSGVYSSSASGIADLADQVGSGYVQPDDLWIANWNGQQNTTDPSSPPTPGPGTSGSTSTAAATTRPTAGRRSTSTTTTSTGRPSAPRRCRPAKTTRSATSTWPAPPARARCGSKAGPSTPNAPTDAARRSASTSAAGPGTAGAAGVRTRRDRRQARADVAAKYPEAGAGTASTSASRP